MSSAPQDEGPLRLAVEDAGDRSAWEAAAAGVLRKSRRMTEDDPDADVWAVLTRTTLDGIEVTPLGLPTDTEELSTEVPGEAPFTRGAPESLVVSAAVEAGEVRGWDLRTPVFATDAAAAHEDALADLENGATSLWIPLVEGGLDAGHLDVLLADVLLDLAPVVLEAPRDPLGAAHALCSVLDERGTDPHPDTNLGGDPLGQLLRRVALGEDAPADEGAADLVDELAALARARSIRAVVVDATAAHDLGASDAQEIGWSLAAGAAYLRLLTEHAEVTVTQAADLIDFRYAATDDQFATIAKLRAARRAWARVCEASGVEDGSAGQRQHAVTSRPMMTRYDPYVNMLRTTVAAFAAGAGGAQAVTALPFDAPLGVPGELGRRVARNISHLLIHESHVGAVADPAGGAYAVERLTGDLTQAAWAELGRIESAGGAAAAVAEGSFVGRVREVAAERERQVAHRTRPLTGVSEFPNLAEELPDRPAWPDGALAVRSYAAAYEEMRDAPAPQPAFLATMGTLAQHTARVTFAANLLAAGGVDTVSGGPSEGVDDVVAAWREQGESPVAVLCGPDPIYAEWGAPLVAALKEAGCAYVCVAGKPRELEVDDHCAVGIDAVAFLGRVREQLGETSEEQS
ncbi:methylmalonyl-CoA mutase [Nocardioidaceae bacterium]|nr:methylmalonyl-CoA mutase [Nocardioidaceae bacterium]